jgi:hypothetical protein
MTHDEYVAAKRILIAELQESADHIVLLRGDGSAEADHLKVAALRERALETQEDRRAE